MSKGNISKAAYFKGLDSFNKHDYVNARYWWKIAYKDPNFKNSSLSRLIKIDLQEGKYAKVTTTYLPFGFAVEDL